VKKRIAYLCPGPVSEAALARVLSARGVCYADLSTTVNELAVELNGVRSCYDVEVISVYDDELEKKY